MSSSKLGSETMFADKRPLQESESTVKDNIVMGQKLDGENLNFGRTIFHSFNEYPDFVGMIDAKTGEKITFAEMKNRSVRCALWLQKQGIGENDVVSLSTPIQMNDYVPFLATLYINAVVNPWHYDASAENTEHFFEICRPKIIFACEESIDKLVKIAKDKGIDCKFVGFDRHPEHSSLEEITSDQSQDEVDSFECTLPAEPRKKVSRIIFTSGTTSKPKAVMLSYHSLLQRQIHNTGLRSGMTCLWYSTFAWIAGGNLTLSAIWLRCTRVVHRAFEAETTAGIIEKYKIDFIFLRSYLLTLCHRADIFRRYDFSHVDTIIFGGTKIDKTVLEECRKSLPRTFVNGLYGSTEAGGSFLKQTKSCKHIESAGYVYSDVMLKVVDASTGALLGPNQEGEIYCKTENAMLGYFKNPRETEITMDKDGWLRSGDMGSYDEDGEVMIGDRLKAMIKTKFYTLSPFEFEETLMQHPDVSDCAVVGVQNPIDIERPFIFVVRASNAKVRAAELIEFAASKNERYRVIGGFAFVDELPYTPSGKKCLSELQRMAEARIEQQRKAREKYF